MPDQRWPAETQLGPGFEDKLQLELSLSLGGQSFSIPGGQVKDFSLRLESHGFTGSVRFWTSLEKADAPLFVAFRKPDLLEVRLSLSGVYPGEGTPPAPLVVQGVARARRLGGLAYGPLEGADRSFRRYSIDFADAAQVLWRHHRPIELYTDKTMADVLDAHKVGPIHLAYDWDVLQTKLPMLCLALGMDDRRTSFYDFVLWFTHARDGVWTYDSDKNQYLLSGAKPSGGKAATLDGREVERVEVQLPPVLRHGTRVLNALAASPSTVPLAQPQAVQGLWHDVLLRTPIPSETEQRQTLEKRRLRQSQRRLRVVFRQLPTVAVHPGALLEPAGGAWSSGTLGAGDAHRVISLALEGQALRQGPHDGQQALVAGYRLAMAARLEPRSDSVPELPPFRAPRYPIHVEAKVHSPGGEASDRTYFVLEDEKTSVFQYRMLVPLWNKTVSVPAEPGSFPGHFYFPPYKNERVLLSLHFDRAQLQRFLDWGENVRMPQDGQGEQMLLGKSKTSQTAISHDFQDSNPVWRLQRVSAGDTETVRIGEGTMLLQVKETQSASLAVPTYDVSPQVEVAKGDLTNSVGGAVGETTAAFQGAMANVRASIEGATAETMAALTAARAEVGAKVAAARAELTGAANALAGRADQLGSAAAEARAALEKLR